MNYYNNYVQDMQLIKLEQPDDQEGTLGSNELTANYKRVLQIDFVQSVSNQDECHPTEH